jgi:hypothetical protein
MTNVAKKAYKSSTLTGGIPYLYAHLSLSFSNIRIQSIQNVYEGYMLILP